MISVAFLLHKKMDTKSQKQNHCTSPRVFFFQFYDKKIGHFWSPKLAKLVEYTLFNFFLKT
jgi:hypothetical protein